MHVVSKQYSIRKSVISRMMVPAVAGHAASCPLPTIHLPHTMQQHPATTLPGYYIAKQKHIPTILLSKKNPSPSHLPTTCHQTKRKKTMANTMPATLVATLESHLTPTLAFTSPTTSPSQPVLHLIPPATLTRLRNLGSGRVKDMHMLGHSRQIISHIPVAAPPHTCGKFNDAMHAAMMTNADKFAALALLPMNGTEAAKELARCVSKYRFVGGVIGLNRGLRIDGEGWEQLWGLAERLRVPIMCREMWPLAFEACQIMIIFFRIRGNGKGRKEGRKKPGLTTRYRLWITSITSRTIPLRLS